MKKSVLFIIKLPPPTNGATLANSFVYNSQIIKNSFNCHFINYGLTKKNDQFGKLKLQKTIIYAKCLLQLWYLLIFKKINASYITIAPKGFGFFKDSIFVLFLKIFRKRRIIHLHGKGIDEKASKSKLWKKYYSFVFKNAELICLTPKLVDDIRKVYKSDPYLVPNGIPQCDYQKINALPKDHHVLLFLSNLYISKGILIFIDAVEILIKQKKTKSFQAWIVGNETDELSYSSLSRIIISKGLEKTIHFLGPKFGDEKCRIYKSADVFCFPTHYPNETFGIVNIEAMEAGLPIVTTPEGGISDIIDEGVNGYLVPQKDPASLADKVLTLLENPSLREKMGVNAREKFIKNYTVDHFEARLTNIIHNNNEPTNPAT